jgi:hypothetical protein
MRKSLIPRLAVLLACSSCHDQTMQAPASPVALRPTADFANAREAAIAAGTAAKRREAAERARWTESFGPFAGPEFGGRIWQLRNGRFAYTTATGFSPSQLRRFNEGVQRHNREQPGLPWQSAGGGCRPGAAPDGPAGSVEIAYWHSHPGSASFSADDRRLATERGLPLFLTRDAIFGRGTVTEMLAP